MYPLDELENDLAHRITYSKGVESIYDFCRDYSGKERVSNIYKEYKLNHDISKPYFQSVIESFWITFKIDRPIYVDFDLPGGDHTCLQQAT